VEGELSVVLGSRVLVRSKGKKKEGKKEVSSCELEGVVLMQQDDEGEMRSRSNDLKVAVASRSCLKIG